MSEPVTKPDNAPEAAQREARPGSDKLPWETPRMEDVSEEVMAQPYIRFT
jgi:hypothetical protein